MSSDNSKKENIEAQARAVEVAVATISGSATGSALAGSTLMAKAGAITAITAKYGAFAGGPVASSLGVPTWAAAALVSPLALPVASGVGAGVGGFLAYKAWKSFRQKK